MTDVKQDDVTTVKPAFSAAKVAAYCRYGEGMKGLMNAISSNKVKAVKVFLSEGEIDINARGVQGGTPLMMTLSGWSRANKSELEIAELLLEKGADPNMKLPSGRTLLHEAARLEDVEVCKLLLKYGADATIKDAQGNAVDMEALKPKPPSFFYKVVVPAYNHHYHDDEDGGGLHLPYLMWKMGANGELDSEYVCF